jgi:MOSC domain-containing protein YiiM
VKLISLNVGQPREVEWRGRTLVTSIFKDPVTGRRRVEPHNVEGDRQADREAHGGRYMAVYAYPSEHYPLWKEELGLDDIPWGAFGENLTIQGILEDEVRIGDRFRIGTAELVVTQPRLPCSKLSARFQRADIVKRFLASGRLGFYLAVERSGNIGAGDDIILVDRDPTDLTISHLHHAVTAERPDRDILERAAGHASLSPGWRADMASKL